MPDGAIPAPAFRLIPPPAVIEVVASALSLEVEDIRGKRRSQSLHYARCIAAFLMLGHTILSKTEIGLALGRADASSGGYLIGCAARLELDDERFRAALEQARQRVLQWSDHV